MTTNPSDRAMKCAREIASLNWGEVKTVMALFDTGAEDRAACEQQIRETVARIIDRHYADIYKELDSLSLEVQDLQSRIY
jgi:hypothetical protein